MNTILAKEFLTNTFNVDWMTEEEINTIAKGMELYARGKCKEQRELCYSAWLGMPEWDSDTPHERRERGQGTILNAPEPPLDL